METRGRRGCPQSSSVGVALYLSPSNIQEESGKGGPRVGKIVRGISEDPVLAGKCQCFCTVAA